MISTWTLTELHIKSIETDSVDDTKRRSVGSFDVADGSIPAKIGIGEGALWGTGYEVSRIAP